MSNRQPIHICFYSNRCKWSKAFLQELAQTPYKQDFRYVCVDPSPTRTKLPDWLKTVPSIVISGEGEPRVGSDVMNWLYEKKMVEATKATASASKPDGSPGAADPMAWNIAENVSFSKGFGYSFNDSDTTAQGDGGLTITGAFGLLNGAAAVGDRNSQEFPGSTNQTGRSKSKKEELFDKQMEAYQRSREDGMPKTLARQ
jgi:hypothetical protein